jgi:hypothetical protein
LRKITLAAIAVLLLLTRMTAIAETFSIQLQSGAFKVAGWTAPRTEPATGWASVFAVYTGTGNLPALVGSYAVEGGSLVFHPRYPFAAGVQYRAVFHPPGGGAPVVGVFDGPPRPVTPLARVAQIYPSGDVLPSNTLRLYIYFSAPMSRGEAAAHIHVLDDKGKDLPGVFLPGQELWDPNFRRLTMTFDPGRIKRGLTSNEAMGPPLTEGKHFTLVIDRDWKDARGVPMTEGFRKSFRGGPSDRNPPDPKQWKVSVPKPGTTEALAVNFPMPMNYPLLQRMLKVENARGNVEGTVSIDRNETEWRWTPREPWKAGDYKLVVDTGLEDVAGNSIEHPFDIDVFDKVTEHITSKTVSVPFTIR